MPLSPEEQLQLAQRLVAEAEAMLARHLELTKEFAGEGREMRGAEESLSTIRAVLVVRRENLDYWQRQVGRDSE